jgi:hypothetical protein
MSDSGRDRDIQEEYTRSGGSKKETRRGQAVAEGRGGIEGPEMGDHVSLYQAGHLPPSFPGKVISHNIWSLVVDSVCRVESRCGY